AERHRGGRRAHLSQGQRGQRLRRHEVREPAAAAMSVLSDPKLQGLIDRLQAKSRAQEAETSAWFSERAKKGELSWDGFDDKSHRFMADKLVALEPAKAEFCYLTCRALQARQVVECGTSFGVSTLYLAAAVRDNCGPRGGGVVIGT